VAKHIPWEEAVRYGVPSHIIRERPDEVVLQLPAVQGLIDLAMLDHLHGLFDLHRNVLIESCVSGYAALSKSSWRDQVIPSWSSFVAERRCRLQTLCAFPA
jgi:hypothetical protein